MNENLENTDKRNIEVVYSLAEVGNSHYKMPLSFRNVNPIFFSTSETALFSFAAATVIVFNRSYKKQKDEVKILFTDDKYLSRYNVTPIRTLEYSRGEELQPEEKEKRNRLEDELYKQLRKDNGIDDKMEETKKSETRKEVA